jgi:cobalt-zinc-cadmium efflux system outer membrane protein
MRPRTLRLAWLLCLAGAGAMPSVSHGQTTFTSPVSASETSHEALTLAQALAIAQANHPALHASAAELAAAAALTRQAHAWPNPELSTLMEDTRRATRTTTVQLNQPIELGNKRAARVHAAQLAEQQAASDLAADKAGIEARLRQAFYGLAIAQARVRLSASLVDLAARAQDIAAKRVAAGKAPPVEAVKAKVAESQAKAASTQAQAEARAAQQWLGQAMGVPQASEAIRVQAHLASLPDAAHWEDLVALVDGSQAVQRARLEVSRRQALADAERARATPDVTLNLGIKRDEQLKLNQPIMGVAVSLPIFDRNQGAYAAAVRQMDKSDAELSALRATRLAQATEALAQLRAASAQSQALRDDILPGARQALEIATKGYEQGKFSFLDVLDAQRTCFEALNQSLTYADAAFRADARLIELLGIDPASKDSHP